MARNKGKNRNASNQRSPNQAVSGAADENRAGAQTRMAVDTAAENQGDTGAPEAGEAASAGTAAGVAGEQDAAAAAGTAGAAATEAWDPALGSINDAVKHRFDEAGEINKALKEKNDGGATQQAVEGAEAAATQGASLSDGQAGGGEPAVSDAGGDQDAADDGAGQGADAGAGGETVAPLYQSHKQVRALKLTDIERNNDTGQVLLTPEDKRYAPFEVSAGWYARYGGDDTDTGYYVLYSDGFSSWSPTKAFEEGYTAMQEAGASDAALTLDGTLRTELLARRCARAAREFAGGVEPGQLFDRDEAAIMAAFVRANPDAPVLAMLNQLTLVKRYPRTVPNRADEFVLSLFHAACLGAHRFEAETAMDEQYALDAEAAAKAAGGWPGEQSYKPQDAGFAPTGFSPR